MARARFVSSFRPGERVEIAPRFDQWMRGDRYGDVVKHSQRFGVYVKMDKSGKTLRFAPDDLTLVNPPTRKAQAFIGRKIRRLAHEGMQAPRRVAAAYSLARRAGFKVPRSRVHPSRASSAARWGARRRNSVATRFNPRATSEAQAWKSVKAIGQYLSQRKDSGLLRRDGQDLVFLANTMLDQLAQGVHENPTLAVLGNPPAKVVGTLSHRLYELRYKHAEDGKDYRHPFGPGAAVKLLADGSVWICARHRLWEDH